MGASKKLIDGHLSSASLRYPHICIDAELLYTDLDSFFYALDERTSNFAGDFRIRMCQTQGKFVIANSCEDLTRVNSIL